MKRSKGIMSEKQINIIYIAPSGRSGSTILDLLLNNHPLTQSVGEVINLDPWKENNLLCSCSIPIQRCPFWNEVYDELGHDFKLRARVQSRIESRTPLRIIKPKERKQYAQRTYSLFNTILNKTGVEYIIDSSKSVGRIKLLADDDRFNIYILHLIRDGRAVASSYRTEKERPSLYKDITTRKLPIYKSAYKWLISNFNLELVRREFPVSSLKIKYEDLTQNVSMEMRKIASFLDIPYSKRLTEVSTKDIHNISGSRWRYLDDVNIISSEITNSYLRGLDKYKFLVFSGFLNKFYGYR